MPGWLRVLLIVFGVMFLCFIAAGAGAYYWFKKNGPRVAAAGRKVMNEAEEFGRKHTDVECVDEALRRASTDSSFTAQVKTRIFAQSCLKVATPTTTLCSAVPAPNEIFEVAKWSTTECSKRGMAGDQTCAGVMQTLPPHCHSPKPTATTFKKTVVLHGRR
jgi:hypothetical protein